MIKYGKNTFSRGKISVTTPERVGLVSEQMLNDWGKLRGSKYPKFRSKIILHGWSDVNYE